jgi:protein-disulfide isomerase
MHSVVAALIASDPKIRLVYRDCPIFGPVSVEAARAAIASQWQGKHEAFNAALYAGAGKLDSPAIRTAANRAVVNWPMQSGRGGQRFPALAVLSDSERL